MLDIIKAKSYQRNTLIISSIVIAILGYGVLNPGGLHVNSVVLAIGVMIVFCLIKIPVVIALISGAMVGTLHSGLSVADAINAINNNLLIGSQVGITYIMIGAFAVAIARTGLIDWFCYKIIKMIGNKDAVHTAKVKWMLYFIFMGCSVLSQNIVPIHIAFIPVMIPPLLGVFDRLRIDRRAVACILACSISFSYLLLPTGFGAIYLNEILLANVNEVGASYGLNITPAIVPKAMFIPVMGIVAGMLVAIFITYKKPRDYQQNTKKVSCSDTKQPAKIKPLQLVFTLFAITSALVCQLLFDSLLIGAMAGFMILSVSGAFKWSEQDDVFTQGMKMMVQIAIIMMVASGFAGALEATGEIQALVTSAADFFGDNKALAAAAMLFVGLFITIGFGDSFASVPILAPIYIPLAISLGFSPIETVALLGASAALGDAGSPASTITLGATAGLNADGQHDHIKDSVIPTFMHANFGMIIFTWLVVII